MNNIMFYFEQKSTFEDSFADL